MAPDRCLRAFPGLDAARGQVPGAVAMAAAAVTLAAAVSQQDTSLGRQHGRHRGSGTVCLAAPGHRWAHEQNEKDREEKG
jgi:hypothetical protein